MDRLDQLAAAWSMAKEKEEFARDERVRIEQEIIALHPAKEEGSETFATPGGARITLTGKISYKVDVEQLIALTGSWPHDTRPLKIEAKPDESRLKMLRAEAPKLWAQIASAVETKPAKTGVAIKWKE